jgi:hypothetical protein
LESEHLTSENGERGALPGRHLPGWSPVRQAACCCPWVPVPLIDFTASSGLS